MDLHAAPVTQLAEAIRRRQLSPLELTEAHIARMEAVNPHINALAARRFERALAEARQATENPPEKLPPLHGIPFTVKEFYQAEGLPWSGGVRRFKDRLATRDSTVVARMRKAGGILLGSSNAPEGGLWMETYNDVYGRTSNPWDSRRTCGGSSGGEGALVGSGASPVGLGSDIGGSIRIPAAFCGAFGHKPTPGRVPGTGHFPDNPGEVGKYLGFGPIGRSARDLALVLDVIAGPDGQDPFSTEMERIGEGRKDLKGLRVIALESNGRMRVDPEVRQAVRRAELALRNRGATIVEKEFPRLKKGGDIWSAALAGASGEPYEHHLTGGEKMQILRNFARLPRGNADHSFAALVLVGLERLLKIVPIFDVPALIAEGEALQAELEEALGPDGVLLYPPYSGTAPRHRAAWLKPFDAECTSIFNILQLPVTVVPMGLDRQGLPLSVQVVGQRRNDALTLKVAEALEEDLSGFRRAEPGGAN